ncbi:hypothetical protein CBS101457_004601 [Exobasidium rhododendri]|nr:hypothetical protein CBS101457_004601 [Exobasidium rhododendri]
MLARPTIQLTDTEDALCVLLDDACRWISSTHPQPDQEESGGTQVEYSENWTLEARIAGGWVRDKLLGLESHDLDIALSSLTGHIFALLLRSYLLSSAFSASGLANDASSPFHSNSSSAENLVGHITRIAANPEQSKNLETATAKVAGLQLDFVNLRKEVYKNDSRIPEMTFGTAHEDAERRDITINTLFFNINTRQVEDLTGLGLIDLKDKVIRTPLSPLTTFLDDPLRVLRCVRFASRFGYKIHQDIIECFQGKDGDLIRDALRSKVSRERFGIEIDKMMTGPDPYKAIQLINALGLFEVVFFPPPGFDIRGTPMASPSNVADQAAALLNLLWEEAKRRSEGNAKRSSWQGVLHDNLLRPLLDTEQRRLLFYQAALLPLRGVEWQEKKGKWVWSGECVLFAGLKLGVNSTRKPASEMMKAIPILEKPVPEVFVATSPLYRGKYIPCLETFPLSPQATMALLVRLPCITSPEFGLSIELCLLWTAVQDACPGPEPSDVLGIYNDFYSLLLSTGLLKRMEEKPIVDGREVQSVLQVTPDKNYATILKRVEAWQFDQDITDANREGKRRACKEWLLREWTDGNIIPLKNRQAASTTKKEKKQKKSN